MSLKNKLGSLVSAGVLAGTLFASGCAAHAGYYYDPYGRQYYAPAREDSYIVQWEGETHRQHEDFNHRKDADRREYWQWRHKHDHDGDHDHDRH